MKTLRLLAVLGVVGVGVAASQTATATEICQDRGDGAAGECSMQELRSDRGRIRLGDVNMVVTTLLQRPEDDRVFITGVYHDGRPGLRFEVRDEALAFDACTSQQDLYSFNAVVSESALNSGVMIQDVRLNVDYADVRVGSGPTYDGAYLDGLIANDIDASIVLADFFAPQDAVGNSFAPPDGIVVPFTVAFPVVMPSQFVRVDFSQVANIGELCGQTTELRGWTLTFGCTTDPAQSEPCAPLPSTLVSSVLPSSRSVQVGSVATAFATIINTGSETATGCRILPVAPPPGVFTYQTTDPATNELTGTPDTPATIPAGAAQSFLFAVTPEDVVEPRELELEFDCIESEQALSIAGLNTLLFSAADTPVPDIVALAATPTGDGILNLPGTNGSNAFSVATVNVGSTATITASPRTSLPLNVTLTICETNPATGTCVSSPGSSTTSSVSGGATPTYSVFVTATGDVPFDPANNRIIVEFKDGGNVVRGSTSVAVRTQ